MCPTKNCLDFLYPTSHRAAQQFCMQSFLPEKMSDCQIGFSTPLEIFKKTKNHFCCWPTIGNNVWKSSNCLRNDRQYFSWKFVGYFDVTEKLLDFFLSVRIFENTFHILLHIQGVSKCKKWDFSSNFQTLCEMHFWLQGICTWWRCPKWSTNCWLGSGQRPRKIPEKYFWPRTDNAQTIRNWGKTAS